MASIGTGCRAAFMHGSQIVLGVLKIILRRNPVAAQGFGTRQRQITLVVSLGVLRLGIRAVESGRFGFAEFAVFEGFSYSDTAALPLS